MRDFSIFEAPKYFSTQFVAVEKGIWRPRDAEDTYLVSLRFTQEVDIDDVEYPDQLAQYPVEDLLDAHDAWIEDFYPEQSNAEPDVYYLEFATAKLDKARKLRSLVGKTVRNVPTTQNGEEVIDLVIADEA